MPKKWLWLVMVMMGFAAGVVAAQEELKELKYPYLPAEYSSEVSITRAELLAFEATISLNTLHGITEGLVLEHIIVMPTDSCLQVNATLRPREGWSSTKQASEDASDEASAAILTKLQVLFPDIEDIGAVADVQLTILEGKPLVIRPPTATSEPEMTPRQQPATQPIPAQSYLPASWLYGNDLTHPRRMIQQCTTFEEKCYVLINCQMTMRGIILLFGSPDDWQVFADRGRPETIYYYGDIQLVFEGGILRRVNKW